MEKKVIMNTRLAVAAVVLLFGLLLAGKEAAAVGYDDLAGPATEKTAPANEEEAAAPATEETTPATEEADAPATEEAAAPATDATEAPTTPTGGKKARYGRASYSKVDCEVPGSCGVAKLAAAADPTRPGAVANSYSRGCNKHLGCRG